VSTIDRQVNEQLIKIMEALLFDENRETLETELSFKYTQPIRPTQFFANIDGKLDGLNRDEYIKELICICHKDYSKLLDYRERLAERAQSIPNCSQTRLVKRNSATRTREEKCTTDCYVLYAYNHGIQNREICFHEILQRHFSPLGRRRKYAYPT